MKNLKALTLIVFALLVGLAAAAYATGWVSRQAGLASNKVVTAAVDIELGSKITPQMLTTLDWPSGSVPPGAFTDVKALQDRVVKVGVLRGEPIVEGKLAPAGSQGGLSAVIAEGKRAMTVRVNDVVGVAGFALPGNYVDVMVNAQQDKDRNRNEEGRQISKTVLEHVLVLAVAQEAGRDDTKPKVVSAVTLELSPAYSEKLDLARSVGTLSLVLRNQVDRKNVATAGVTKSELFGEAVPVPAKPAAPRLRAAAPPKLAQAASTCVEVVQNGTRALNCF
jgi:pilus assembly protein CpaB